MRATEGSACGASPLSYVLRRYAERYPVGRGIARQKMLAN